jgi:hypothetical protein
MAHHAGLAQQNQCAETDSLSRKSKTETFKDFIGRHIFHPFQGMTLGTWWAFLRRHHFAINLRHLPRALVQTSISASNSVNARSEWRLFGGRIEAVHVDAPLFILGHYSSGTTHLQNLLALDPHRAAPTLFQVLNPHTFLSIERVGSRGRRPAHRQEALSRRDGPWS